MINEVCVLLLLVCIGIITLYKVKITDDCDNLFDKNWSLTLKGLCCIVVILVHIPEEHSTHLQNLIGSFAFVAVSIFFLVSGYGVSISKNRKGYMEHFWKNRMAALLIPMFLVNVIATIVKLICGEKVNIVYSLLVVNSFVLMITACYAIFYVVHRFCKADNRKQCFITCLGIFILSVLAFAFENTTPFTVWPVPCLSFIYGICLAENRSKIVTWIKKQKCFDWRTILLVVLSIAIGGGYTKAKYIFFLGNYVLRAFLAIVLIALLIKLTAHMQFNNKVILSLGKISYEVYLSHGIVIELFDKFCGEFDQGLYIIGVVAMTILLSYFTHLLNQKIITKIRTQ